MFLFILGGLVVPFGLFLFFVFCSPIGHGCFCVPALFVASLLSSLDLGPGESCAVAVNASAIAQWPWKFIKGFSSSSLSSFWSKLLAFFSSFGVLIATIVVIFLGSEPV